MKNKISHTTNTRLTVIAVGWILLIPLAILTMKNTWLVEIIYSILLFTPLGVFWYHKKLVSKVDIQSVKAHPFHVCQKGCISINIYNGNKFNLVDTTVRWPGDNLDKDNHFDWSLEIKENNTTQVNIPIPPSSLKRGLRTVGTVQALSGFPFNLFSSTISKVFDQKIIVYPAIESLAPDWPERCLRQKRKQRVGEDIIGHRDFRIGDDARAIDWKLSARRGDMIVREYEDPYLNELEFSLEDVQDIPLERGLERITAWILRAEKEKRYYSLHLANNLISSNLGISHKNACLRALAVYGDNT